MKENFRVWLTECRMPCAALERILHTSRQAVSSADSLDALRRFAAGNPQALDALIRRHGPMVLGVCRGILGPSPDANDAFQPSFLALARRSPSIVTCWE